jgi:hypothetical protein
MTVQKITTQKGLDQHRAGVRQREAYAARLRDRPRPTRKSIERRIVDQVIAKYGDPSPEAASARRVAKAFGHLMNNDVSALPLPEIEDALADAAKTYRRVDMWVAQFYTRRGRPPPLTLLRGGLYEEQEFNDGDGGVEEITTEP